MVGAAHPAVDAVGVERDVAGRVNALLVGLQKLVDRCAPRTAERGVADEFEVHLAADGHQRQRGGVAVAVLGLDVT